MTQQFIDGTDISYGEMERQGFDPSFIEDYQSLKREFRPLTGTITPPTSTLKANQSGLYIKVNAPAELWFNSTPGSDTGWIQLI